MRKNKNQILVGGKIYNSDNVKNKLEEWYNEQPFDIVFKITGLNPMDYPEYDDKPNEEAMDRDCAIKQALDIWDVFHLDTKVYFYELYGDGKLFKAKLQGK